MAITEAADVRRETLAERATAITVNGACTALDTGGRPRVVVHRERRRAGETGLDCGGVLEIHRLGFTPAGWLHKGERARTGVARRGEILGVVG